MQPAEKNIFNPTQEQREKLAPDIFNIVVTTEIGPMLVNRHDRYVGGSLVNYGELCRGEATLFSRLLHPDDVAIEAGANIGAHTVLLSKLVGEEGTVYAFEPQRIVFQTLCANLALNQCTNVIAHQQGVGSVPGEMIVPTPDPRVDNNFGGLSLLTQGDGEAVAIVTIDSLRLPRCHLIKADVEGMEAAVLAGAQETIQRCRPTLYLENDRQEKSAELIAAVMALGYRLWWHIVPLFEPNNFAGNKEDIFGGTVSVNMLCQPAELALPVPDWPEITRPDDLWEITLPTLSKPPAPSQIAMKQDACPICGGAAHALDTLNGSCSCEDRRGLALPPADWSAEYFLCADCGFCCAPAFRDWTAEMFAERIYNAAYPEVDPDYLTLRPQGNTRRLIDAFGTFSDKRHLDYGGGHGAMSRLLREAGWSSVSCDPFHGDTAALADDARFDLITAFEVFEHDPQPHRLLDNIQRHLTEPGLVLFSTLLHDGHIAPGKPLDWWYAAPRNGHVSLYSRDSLRRLAQTHGLHCISLSPDLHAFWRVLPAWAETLIARPVADLIERLSPLPSAAMPADANATAGDVADDMANESACLARLAANPADHAALHMLGLFAFAADDLPLAIERLEAAIAIDDTIAAYHSDLGELYRLAGQPEKSALAGRRAVALAPGSADAHYRLGLACDDAGDRAEALACYRRATQCDPRHFLGWYYLGQGLAEQGDTAAAIDALTHAVNLAPDHAEAQHALGLLLRDLGECAAARHCFEMALRARPDYVAAHAHLAPLKTYKKDDPQCLMLTDLYSHRADMHEQARALCCFAYAKMCEDTGDHEQAFAAYAESNQIKAALLPFDEAREEAQTAAMLRLFDRNFIAARQQPAAPAAGLPTPIFIVGMPCAGAGWLKQMLTRHPLAGAAHVDFGDLLADAAQPFPDLAATLDVAAWRALGECYLQLAAQQAPGKTFVIDRNPENVRYLGLIHLALPQARIVHVMRDPLDSCFSLYASNAEPDIAYSHDLSLLGRQYVRYIHLMRHWHAVLPPRTIEDVHYEDLVRETGEQTRRVVAFAGLPWSEQCLQTPVKIQRAPLFARWHNFEQHLEPLYALIKHYRQENGADNPLAEARHNTLLSRANQLYAEDHFTEALAHYDQALAIRPGNATTLLNKGIALRDLRRSDEAVDCFNAALTIAPGMKIARFNLGSVQLKNGDWQAGWENYEARWHGNDQTQKSMLKPPPALYPQWSGKADTECRNLLVFSEQGIGDSLQFVRYLSLAKQRFAKVGFVCPMPLLRLMEWSFGDDIMLLTTEPKAANLWDKQSPLMSLPRAFQTRPDTVPADVPYLHVPAVAKNYWQDRLAAWPTKRRLRVGLAWTGNKNYVYDARRSLAFEQLQTLWPIADVTWVNLQVRMPKDTPPPVPESVDWIDWTMELVDFADTAALVANLDLVISIDSAIAHLAGALGRPTWLLNRFESEWRWLLNREDSPWYPTMRIFNQPSFGDWESVLQSIAAALQALAKHNPEHGR